MSGRSTEVPGRVDATDESGDERGSAFALATTVAFGAALGSAGLNDPLHPVRETSLVPAVDDVLAGTRMVLLVVTGVDAEAVSRSARQMSSPLFRAQRELMSPPAEFDLRAQRELMLPPVEVDLHLRALRELMLSPIEMDRRFRALREVMLLDEMELPFRALREVMLLPDWMNVPPQHQPSPVSSCLPPLSEFPPKIDQNALALVPLKKMSTEDETPKLAQNHQQACPSRQPALGPKPTSTHP